jgi:hypothetical protein
VDDKPVKLKDDPEGNHTPNPMEELREVDEMQHEALTSMFQPKCASSKETNVIWYRQEAQARL